MARFVSGDALSLARYREYLRSLAGARVDARLQAQFDASDIVQEAMLKAHRARDQFRGQTEQELAAWLKTILNNTLANAVRTCSRQRIVRSHYPNTATEASSIHGEPSPVDSQPAPDETAAKNEQLLRLARALARLPIDQRQVMELRHLQGLTASEICASTGRSKPSVVGLLYRGVKAMRVLMDEPDMGTSPCRTEAN
jgi:RNA polymerase sigma-70 factor (ECF subfamily)